MYFPQDRSINRTLTPAGKTADIPLKRLVWAGVLRADTTHCGVIALSQARDSSSEPRYQSAMYTGHKNIPIIEACTSYTSHWLQQRFRKLFQNYRRQSVEFGVSALIQLEYFLGCAQNSPRDRSRTFPRIVFRSQIMKYSALLIPLQGSIHSSSLV